MIPLFRLVAALALVAGVSVGAFFAVRELRGGSGAQADIPASGVEVVSPEQPSGPQGPPSAPFDDDNAQPRFAGDLLGIYLAPIGSSPPDSYVIEGDVCGPRDKISVTRVPWEQTGQFGLSQLQLPGNYHYLPTDMNSSAWACNGKLFIANRTYSVDVPSGFAARVTVNRDYYTWNTPDAPASRIEATTIGGRPAILVKPVIPDGRGSPSMVIFPGSPIVTTISAANLPLVDLLSVASAVAAQMK